MLFRTECQQAKVMVAGFQKHQPILKYFDSVTDNI